MKTYIAYQMLGRLSEHLVTFKKPFTFDGYAIEFTASEEFMQRMYELDQMLQQIEFGIY